jgi:hypothetical protein
MIKKLILCMFLVRILTVVPIQRSPVLLRTPRLSTRCEDNHPELGSRHRRFLRVKDDHDRALAAQPGRVR